MSIFIHVFSGESELIFLFSIFNLRFSFLLAWENNSCEGASMHH